MKKNIFEQKTFIVLTFLFFNILVLSSNIVIREKQTLLEYSIGSVVSPIQTIIANTIDFAHEKWENYFFSKNIYNKYKKLKKEIFDLKTKNYVLKSKLKSLEKYSNLVNIKSEKYRLITHANVVYLDKNFLYSSIIINSGTLKKIKKNMLVINENFELIGSVTDTITPLTAKVRLITNKNGGLGAYVSNKEMEGFLTGNNNKICSFKYLIESKPIKIGDIVTTSGTDGIFPESIPIGKVVNIKKGYLEQEVDVKPFFLNRPINNLIIIERIK